MAVLFERVAKPLGAKDIPGCWLAGLRLVAFDGTCPDVPDTPANESHLGAPADEGRTIAVPPSPSRRALAKYGIQTIFVAMIGPYTTSEAALSSELIGGLRSGMLCLADRGFYSFKGGKRLWDWG